MSDSHLDRAVVSGVRVEVQAVNPEEINDEEGQEDGADEGVALEVVNNEEKQYLELDMVNYTLVRCDKTGEDESPRYELIAASSVNSKGEESASEDTVYVLQQPINDGETAEDGSAQYVVLESVSGDAECSYGRQKSLYVMQYEQSQPEEESVEEDTSATLLAQVIHSEPAYKVRNYSPMCQSKENLKDRRRKNNFPSPQALLTHPNFKLYLYSCKICEFQCNAIQELRDHKKSAHPVKPAARPWRPSHELVRPAKSARGAFACQQCDLVATSRVDLKNHILANHHRPVGQNAGKTTDVTLYQCDVCSFECKDRRSFNMHADTHLSV